jgi:coiled-coil domain-containing protein 130
VSHPRRVLYPIECGVWHQSTFGQAVNNSAAKTSGFVGTSSLIVGVTISHPTFLPKQIPKLDKKLYSPNPLKMQGFNMGRYVPPDEEGLKSGNKLHKKHALGSRASKLSSHGILTVRFEMPFPIWCQTCPKPTIIGQGVRFNAAKQKVGNYHSTPIWSFRIKHPACGGAIEIQTDPKNTAYVVVSGAKKRDTGVDVPRDGDLVIVTDQEREQLRSSAFASLEKTIGDREQLVAAKQRLDELADVADRHWDDPFRRNQSLRRSFRVGRKEREKDAARDEEIKERMGLGIELLPATESDARRAALVDFGASAERDGYTSRAAFSKPLFAPSSEGKISSRTKKGGKPNAGVESVKKKDALASEIVGNTRIAQDPFLVNNKGEARDVKQSLAIGVKRKRGEEEENPDGTTTQTLEASSKSLVEYDSD